MSNFSSKETPDKTNLDYVPRITQAMSWNFSEGNILDFGCGSGVTAYNLILPQVEATNSKMYSFDISEAIVAQAEKMFPHPRIVYRAGTFPQDFPFADIEFDKIYSVNVIHFIKDFPTTLKGLAGVLKPGGQMGFTFTTMNCPVMKILKDLSESPKWEKYTASYKDILPLWADYGNSDPEEHFKQVFTENTGLKVTHFEFIKQEDRFTTKKCLEIFLAMNPSFSKIPAQTLNCIREEYYQRVAKMLGHAPSPDSIPFPVEYICAVLEKPTCR